MSEVDLVEVLKGHVEIDMADAGGANYCDKCLQAWPCDATRLADEVERLRKAELRLQRDLRGLEEWNSLFYKENRKLTKENTRQREDIQIVLDGFDKTIFVRNVSQDSEPDWAVKAFPFLAALARLQVALHPESRAALSGPKEVGDERG